MRTSSFREQSVIVTGASSGIGRSLALRLADQGAQVALAARSVERLEVLARACRQRGGRALDERTVDQYGRLDMLVNNAGVGLVAKLEELPDLSLFKQVLDVNLYGAVYCTYHALPYLKQSQGRLVNVSSLGGRVAIPHNTAYIASKFALGGLSESLRTELRPDGVSVTVIAPYWVVTGFHEHYMDKDGRPKGPGGRALYTQRAMTADTCARVILDAAYRRKREVVMRSGSLALWCKLLAPNLLDRLVLRLVLRPAVRRL